MSLKIRHIPQTCFYCKTYWESESVKTGKVYLGRKCKDRGGKMVQAVSKVCKKYQAANYFHCDTRAMRITAIECMARRANPYGFELYKICQKCNQWFYIKKLIDDDTRQAIGKILAIKKAIAADRAIARLSKNVNSSKIKRVKKKAKRKPRLIGIKTTKLKIKKSGLKIRRREK